MLKEITVEIERKNSDTIIQPRLPGLRVDIRGLDIHGSMLTLDKCMTLFAPVTDTRGISTPFRDAVRLGLGRAGFLVANLGERSAGNRLTEPYTRLISTKRVFTNADNNNPTLVAAGLKQKLLLRFGATELYPKYREFIWAKDVHLEKLSICRTGLRDIYKEDKLVGQGYEEIASVPLPGAPSVSSGPLLEGETFEPPHGSVRRGKWQ